ncbi:hypothetical protein FEM48_Zijuj08G0063100 [Ziziphus jujuba var. spinosa]|uniref:Protein AATF n=1 Tax=Ziziphus jujuba var. spinosa TaxID=714518 RepID=A0A978UXG6_ZIZJJ|nr:hypothetical protein FEM48_Zijuj08G0063100 [Ziziphus jujuba var. spinosa]
MESKHDDLKMRELVGYDGDLTQSSNSKTLHSLAAVVRLRRRVTRISLPPLTLSHKHLRLVRRLEGSFEMGKASKLRKKDSESDSEFENYGDDDDIGSDENLKRHKDEDLLKGQAVKNQKALWDKTLEFRFLLQKPFSSSNRLPQEPVRSSFCESDKDVSAAYSDLIISSKETLDSMLELQEALLEKNPSILQAADGKIAPFRNRSIDKWQRKTQVTTGAAAIKSKLQAFNQNVSEQVASYMRDPSRMIKQMQLRRSTVGVFGAVSEGEDIPKEENSQTDGSTLADGDPELLDDSDFYQQLLKEFFEMVDPASSVTHNNQLAEANSEAAFYALKKLQTKKRKIVDRRASKSRKIRYNVHEKIVNFMAPQPMDLPSMAPKLFENLFGLKTQKPASVA